MELLPQYIIALSHLYGAVHKDVVADIYNLQNDNKIKNEDVDYFLNNPSTEIEHNFTFVSGDYFVIEAIAVFNRLDDLLLNQKSKPRYIPEKIELLKYVDSFYFYESDVYKAFYEYMKEEVLNGDDERAKDVCEDIEGMIEVNAEFPQVISVFDHMKVKFKTKNQRERVLSMVSVLQDNVRLWYNNGYTNSEIRQLNLKASISNRTHRPSKTAQPSKGKKLGRNDPCHCGSGKKYKKCCLALDEKWKLR